MTVYNYKARDTKGHVLAGFQEASNETEVVKILQSNGLLVTSIATGATSSIRQGKRKRHRGIKLDDYLVFTRESATLLEAGIPLLRAIEVITEQIESQKLHDALLEVLKDIRSGSTLKDAIAKQPKVFPSLWVYLIEAGEVSGNLVMVLGQIANNLESSINLRKKLVSALAYPAVLVCVAVGAVFVFLLKIIPVFDALFKSMNAKLPFLTQVVIDLSRFLQHYFFFAVIGVGALAYFLKRYVATDAGRRQLDTFVLRLPVFGRLVQDSILARIMINFATLTKSGVSILQTVEISARASGNSVYRDSLEKTRLDIQQGKTMSASMAESALYSPLVIHMIMIGEESGKLADMLQKIAKYYDAKVEVFLGRLGVLIEPLILILIGGVIGFLVVAMFLPILSLSQIVK